MTTRLAIPKSVHLQNLETAVPHQALRVEEEALDFRAEHPAPGAALASDVRARPRWLHWQ